MTDKTTHKMTSVEIIRYFVLMAILGIVVGLIIQGIKALYTLESLL